MSAAATGRLDLDAESRRVLEYDAVLGLVAGHAVSPMGGDAVRGLEPSGDRAWIAEEHAAVNEVVRHLREQGRCVSGGIPDPSPALSALAVDALAVPGRDLRDLATALVAADDSARALSGLSPEAYPRLRELAGRVPRLGAAARAVLENTGPDGAVLDGASRELRRIRMRIAQMGERLRGTLRRLMRDPGAEASIRDDFITQRNGRFVIPVRTDAPHPVRGIVHASSSSGATQFVEPLESVELNNELVRLADDEREEEDRILRSWADAFRHRVEQVRAAVAGLARLDSLQARALFAEREGGITPSVEEGKGWSLGGVRHPLLERSLRERGARCVPLDLSRTPAERILVLSGPNTGGKTVALKALGLTVLMAHAGLPVVATSARVPLFRQVRADIGDHQSIAASLSTYSAHVRALATFFRDAAPPALFLFDELGTGTEPVEGAALAQAVLERLLGDGIDAVVTTHQGALKAWAVTTPGALSAAMEFDLDRLQPTYRVIQGAAGVSAGLDIAARLDLPEAVVSRARDLLGPETRTTEAHLERIRELLGELERRREAARLGESELARQRERLLEDEHRERERRSREAASALGQALEEFRELGRREVRAVRDAAERARVAKRQERAEGRLRVEAERRRRIVAEPHEAGSTGPAPAEVGPGSRVRVRSLGRDGEVEEVRGRQVRVRLGSSTFTVDRDDLAAAGSVPASPGASARQGRRAGPSPDPPDDTPAELHVIGRTVDEALPELDRFLDRSVRTGRNEVRVVHGHGTGRLRAAVRRYLDGHPLVESHRAGSPAEGGDGATVARLR